jgi:MFS family permease
VTVAKESRTWLVPFFTHTLLVQAITFVLRPTAVYKALELDVPTQYLGAMGASFAVVPLLLAVPSGQAVDRFGERRVMFVGSILTLGSAAGFAVLGGSVWGLLGSSVVLGTGHLCSVVGQQAMVANRTAQYRYDTAFGHYTFAASAGQAIGPGLIIVFGGANAIPDVQTIFTWAIGLGALLVAVCALLPAQTPVRQSSGENTGSVRDLLRRRGLVRALMVSCVVLAAVDISLVYLPALGTERGISAGTIGMLLTVRAVASMTSRFFLGRLVGWMGRARLLTTSIAIAALGMALVPVPMPSWLLVALVAAMGLGLGAGQPLTMSWLAEATPAGLRGRAMSLRLTGNRLGQVIVPSVAGLLALSAGSAGVLWLTAASLAAVGVTARGITPTVAPPAPDPTT